MKIITYLNYTNCNKVIAEYKKVFDAKLINHRKVNPEIMKLGSDFDYENSTLHAHIEIFGTSFYISDLGHQMQGAESFRAVSLAINPETMEEALALYKKIQNANWRILVPFEKQFWGDYYSEFKDPFGMSWIINLVVKE